MNRRDERNVLITISITIIIAIAWIVGIDALKAESAKEWTEPVVTVSASELAEWNKVKGFDVEATTEEFTTEKETTVEETTVEETTTEATTTTAEPTATEQTTTIAPETEPVTEPVIEVVDPVTEVETQAIPHYSIVENGIAYTLDYALQDYTYQCCVEFGIDWYYPTMLAQMYQESNYSLYEVSSSGDYGICQLKGKYHDYFRQLMNDPTLDFVNDPYANIKCGVFLMSYHYKNHGSMELAQTMYRQGTLEDGIYYPYVDIINHWLSLEVLE